MHGFVGVSLFIHIMKLSWAVGTRQWLAAAIAERESEMTTHAITSEAPVTNNTEAIPISVDLDGSRVECGLTMIL
jgi:hypothetical protein